MVCNLTEVEIRPLCLVETEQDSKCYREQDLRQWQPLYVDGFRCPKAYTPIITFRHLGLRAAPKRGWTGMFSLDVLRDKGFQ